jgi:hypothetical protein
MYDGIVDLDESILSAGEMTFIEDDLLERFGPCLNSEEVEALNSSVVSKNTSNRNKWALKVYEQWCLARNIQDKTKICDLSNQDLKDILPRFIHEVRRKDGVRYPNSTLVSIIAGIVNGSVDGSRAYYGKYISFHSVSS